MQDINDFYNSDNTKMFAEKLLVPKFVLDRYVEMDIELGAMALGVDPALIAVRLHKERGM